MTSARNQPFCKKYNINIGCFDGTRMNPRNLTQRNTSLFIYNNHFCLIWKSDGVSFDKAIKELKDNFIVLILSFLIKMLKVLLSMNTFPKKLNLLI